jgi:hypothetical protein
MHKKKYLLSAALATLVPLVAFTGSPKRASAVTITLPTAGLAATSTVVGAAATAEGSIEDTRSKWNRKFLIFSGLLIVTVDPDPAAYLEGKSVITFPDKLLEFQELTKKAS